VKHRVRLPPKERVRLPSDFDFDAYFAARERLRLPNIPDSNECKYIYGEITDEDAHYCGRKTVKGYSWCKRHKKLCTRVIVDDGEQVYRRRGRPRRT
jgi:hypothetical protein